MLRITFLRLVWAMLTLVTLVGCNPPQDQSDSTAPTIESVNWTIGNFAPDYWASESTALIFFSIGASDPAGLSNISSVQITGPQSTFDLFDATTDVMPTEFEGGLGFFDCCWWSRSETPHQRVLGNYVVTVENDQGDTTTHEFVVDSVEGDTVSGSIYSPEMHPGISPSMLARPTISQMDVDGVSVDLTLNLNDSRTQSYDVLFYSSEGYLSAYVDLYAAQTGTFDRTILNSEINFQSGFDSSDLYAAQITGTSEPVSSEVIEVPYIAVSDSYVRDSYTAPPVSNSVPFAYFSSSPSSSGETGTNFTFNASSSSDSEDLDSALQFRWDWNNDGTWDTNYVSSTSAEHVFDAVGTYTVMLEVLDTGGLSDTYSKTYNIVLPGSNNTAPNANFSSTPFSSGYALSTFKFNAANSSDSQDLDSALQFRWDWNNDGTWDTNYASTITAEYQFPEAGSYTVVLEVLDTGGLSDTYSRNYTIQAAPIVYGSLVDLQFSPTDWVYDDSRDVLYLADRAGKKLYVVDAQTGFITNQLTTLYMPQALYLSSDQSMLYVAELHSEFSTVKTPEEEAGDIVSIDLGTFTATSRFSIILDPWDMVVTSTGDAYVSGGSNYNTFIKGFDLTTGIESSSVSVTGDDKYMSLTTDDARIYVGDGSYIERYDLGNSGISFKGNSDYISGISPGDKPLYISPDDQYLIGERGDIYQLNSMYNSDMVWIGNLFETNKYISSLSFDPAQDMIFVLTTANEVISFNASNWMEIETIDHSSLDPDGMFVTPDQVILIDYDFSDPGQLNLLGHPCLTCGVNTAPTAAMTVNIPTGGDTADTFVFDASGSVDSEEGNALSYRWDFESDGVFETQFSTETGVSQTFFIPGSYNVKVQAKDSGGLVSTASLTLDVAQGTIVGQPVDTHTAFELPYEATEMLYDETRNRLYITDRLNGLFYIVDPTTGQTESQIEIGMLPEYMSFSPDGNKLYIAVSIINHAYNWPGGEENKYGYIAEIDLTSMALTKYIRTVLDPFSVVVANDGTLIVSDGSDQHTTAHRLDPTDGTLVSTLGNTSLADGTHLVMHPDYSRIYGADTGVSPSDIERIDVDPNGSITYIKDSIYHGDYSMSGYVYITPDGNHLITRGADIFSSDIDPALDMLYQSSLNTSNIEDLAFDEAQNLFFTVNQDGLLEYFNLSAFGKAGTITHNMIDPQFVFVTNSGILAASINAGSTSLSEFNHPCPGCNASTQPSASFSVTPASGGTVATQYLFDASASTDSEDLAADLMVCWDFDGDEICDTDYSTEKTYAHYFSAAGSKFVNLYVIDTSGLIAISQLTVNVGS